MKKLPKKIEDSSRLASFRAWKKARKEKRQKKENLIGYHSGNDIKYQGPIGIFGMRVISWLFFVCANISVAINLWNQIFNIKPPSVEQNFFALLGGMALPCFILTAFFHIMKNSHRCKFLLVYHGILSVLFSAFFYVIILHYCASLYSAFDQTSYRSLFSAGNRFLQWFHGTTGTIYSFNIFIDLFLYTLLVFFWLNEPPEFFQNKKRLFRFLALLPILYELAFCILRVLQTMGLYRIPFILYIWMPTKAPLVFLAFLRILFMLIRQKKRFFKQGGNPKEYQSFLSTRKNSLLFSQIVAKNFALFGFLDFVLFLIFSILREQLESETCQFLMEGLRLGKSLDLLLFSPFVLLFSYNRENKLASSEKLIPVGGAVMVIMVYIEFGYRLLMTFLQYA